jgi:hypothetical protein
VTATREIGVHGDANGGSGEGCRSQSSSPRPPR